MKVQIQNERSRAFGLLEVLVILALLAILAAVLLPVIAAPKRQSQGINCIGNIKQVNLAFRIWEGDNNNQYPMGVSVTNGGAMELIKTGNVGGVFEVMSNELSTTRILVCPDDSSRASATNWIDLNGSYISYFVSADVTNESNPDSILDGDDNFQLNGSSVKSGLFDLSSNTLIEWSSGRHSETFRPHIWSFPKRIYWGNIGFADGHVEALGTSRLQKQLQFIDPKTNRISIP